MDTETTDGIKQRMVTVYKSHTDNRLTDCINTGIDAGLDAPTACKIASDILFSFTDDLSIKYTDMPRFNIIDNIPLQELHAYYLLDDTYCLSSDLNYDPRFIFNFYGLHDPFLHQAIGILINLEYTAQLMKLGYKLNNKGRGITIHDFIEHGGRAYQYTHDYLHNRKKGETPKTQTAIIKDRTIYHLYLNIIYVINTTEQMPDTDHTKFFSVVLDTLERKERYNIVSDNAAKGDMVTFINKNMGSDKYYGGNNPHDRLNHVDYKALTAWILDIHYSKVCEAIQDRKISPHMQTRLQYTQTCLQLWESDFIDFEVLYDRMQHSNKLPAEYKKQDARNAYEVFKLQRIRGFTHLLER